MRELSYNDTEREIEIKIYGLNFKISDKIEKLNTEEIQKQAETDEKIIEKVIDDILGENATQKINEQRAKDGYDEMNLNVQTQVLNWIVQQYTDEVLEPINKTVNRIQNRNYRRNGKYNNRYRRY